MDLEEVSLSEKNNSVDESIKQDAVADSLNEKPKLDKLGRSYATGKRKASVARVWIKQGPGQITVNKRSGSEYFTRQTHMIIINQPLEATNRVGEFNIFCTVKGGGLSGQAGAVRHAVSKALVNFDPSLRKILKEKGFLTRDSRVVERKKYGQPKARRKFQFSKR
tara:strand:- start:99 stop:593 length:495 start_codon:yes stop_codon:yes gene_type:complete